MNTLIWSFTDLHFSVDGSENRTIYKKKHHLVDQAIEEFTINSSNIQNGLTFTKIDERRCITALLVPCHISNTRWRVRFDALDEEKNNLDKIKDMICFSV